MNRLQIRFAEKMSEVDATEWDACVAHTTTTGNPFLSHAFLNALERSGCTTDKTGWRPLHLILENENKLVGAMPNYLKSHSQGEYVFDHGWAQAMHQIGEYYYPKLQSAVPFTPVTGPRLLTHPEADRESTEKTLLNTYRDLCKRLKVSSAHITFMPEAQWKQAGEMGWLQRIDQQYHWLNQEYDSFDAFLAEMPSKKRKNLKRERREAVQDGIEIEWITGKDLTEHHWDTFFEFYLDTGSRKYGVPYLNRQFFSLINDAMSDKILLMLCQRNKRYIAGALHFIGADTLYGRHWGCAEDHKFLHFETCYYQAIDFAIQHRLKRVEAGAQGGGHKFMRGYLPCLTYSAHWIEDPRLQAAVRNFLDNERNQVEYETALLAEQSPYKSQKQID